MGVFVKISAARNLSSLLLVTLASAIILSVSHPVAAGQDHPTLRVEPNDNRRSAGRVDAGVLTLALRADRGRWQPEGPQGPSLDIEAFGEVGRPLAVPAPLIRVVEGTEIAASIHNALDEPLVVHGLCTRGGSQCPPIKVAPQQTVDMRFPSGSAGTYHYWASAQGAPIPFRELAGAFVVDRKDAPVDADRILVITEWTSLTGAQLREIMSADRPSEAFVGFKPKMTFVINGLSWPATERLTYDLDEPVRWRVLNLSSQPHPLHLHGFYFEVTSQGDGLRDTGVAPDRRRQVVTHLLPPAGTITLTWRPERAGNWLFHCHVMHHVSPDRRLSDDESQDAHGGHGGHAHGAPADAPLGMAGMVIGVKVRERASTAAELPDDTTARRRLTLIMRRASGGTDALPAAGFVLQDGDTAVAGQASAPGPPIVLRRGEPVEISVVNQLDEATAIHWHGMELESYYDGVHGFSGAGRRVTPMIAPGGSFAVRFTPPRAGTFIYHTHLHDYRQLSSGLYGPLVVVNADERFDSETDHVVVLGRNGLTSETPSILTDPDSVVINGVRRPTLVMKAGTRHRVRLINITPDDVFSVSFQDQDGPVTWTLVAKDGAAVPKPDAVASKARQAIAVGETYDFEFDAPKGRKTMWLEVRTLGGKWQAQGQVMIK
jgi:FtsP/CotA-like multicopper oxidase with cupredoxin domain